MKTKILLVDDHLVVRMGLSLMISRQGDMKLVGEAENGEQAVVLAGELQPDVIIMDLQMPIMDGATATQKILVENPGARILILTTFGATADAARALNAGAVSAISKDSSQESLLAAIRATARGEKFVSQEIADIIAEKQLAPTLSPRQKDILRLVAKGFNNEEIAEQIGITRHGVKAHLAIAFDRLGASSRTEAASLALSLGLI